MKRFIRLLMVAFVVILGIYVTYENKKMEKIQQGIADKIIRFHVRANSDSEKDQNIKTRVKENVVDYLYDRLSASESLDETKQILTDNMDEIKEIAVETVRESGENYDVNVYFEEAYFPLRTYGDMSFPPGVYEAFRIDIGDYEGKNWWCVLYPPLCFVDSTYAVVPDASKQQFKEILSPEEYCAVTVGTLSKSKVKFEFKYFKFLNRLMP